MDALRYVGAAAFLEAVIFLPGWAALTARGIRGLNRIVYAPWITIGASAGVAAAAVAFDLSFSTASWLVFALLVGVAGGGGAVAVGRGGRRSLSTPDQSERMAMLLVLAASAFLVGFNGMPSNPPGSINPCAPPTSAHHTYTPILHPGPCNTVAPPYVSMPRLPERAQDDLLQFRTAQAIWNHRLFGDREFSGGWRLQDRTPLLGLVTAALAAPDGVSLPTTYPAQPMFPRFGPAPLWLKKFGAPHDSSITPKTQPDAFAPPGSEPVLIDKWGYWYYRLLAILLNVLFVLPTFGVGTLLFNARVGSVAAVAAGLSPAVMQNAYYTSPKYLGVYFGLCALLLVIMRRPGLAGFGVGLSYLCHPLGVILGAGVALFQLLRRSVRGTVVLVLVALSVAAPWYAFTAHTGRSSNLAAYPLGCVGPSVTVSSCEDQFVDRPRSDILWQRVLVLPNLILPPSLSPNQPLQPPSFEGLRLRWLTMHDLAFPGMVGFAFFVFAIVGAVRAWRTHRRFLMIFGGGQLLALLVVMGVPGWAAWLGGLGLLPLLYVLGAYGLISSRTRTAFLALAIIGLEWLVYIAALYRPLDNVSAEQYAICSLLILASLLALGHCAVRSIRDPAPDPAATAVSTA